MDENTTVVNEIPDRFNSTLSMLPAGVQVLIDWVILLISTLISFFQKKNEE